MALFCTQECVGTVKRELPLALLHLFVILSSHSLVYNEDGRWNNKTIIFACRLKLHPSCLIASLRSAHIQTHAVYSSRLNLLCFPLYWSEIIRNQVKMKSMSDAAPRLITRAWRNPPVAPLLMYSMHYREVTRTLDGVGSSQVFVCLVSSGPALVFHLALVADACAGTHVRRRVQLVRCCLGSKKQSFSRWLF